MPTRGNIHDLSGAITHKKEIITLYLDISPPGLPDKEAVDRYIRDYESVKVVRTATADIDKVSQITRLSKRVISQYLCSLIPQHQLQAIDANLANSAANDLPRRSPDVELYFVNGSRTRFAVFPDWKFSYPYLRITIRRVADKLSVWRA